LLEIIAYILGCLEENSLKKTHLTNKAGVDYRAASKYIPILLSHDLIEKSKEDDSYFVITEKGREYVRRYKGLLALLGNTSLIIDI
jgi:predicted transcriptional regulator